jgi:hypothetical protein
VPIANYSSVASIELQTDFLSIEFFEKSRMWTLHPETKKYLRDAVDAGVDMGKITSYNDEIVPISNYSSVASIELQTDFLSIGKLLKPAK